MKALVGFVNEKGLKLGIYSTPWMSTYAGYIGGSAPNETGDYSAYFLPESERLNPHQRVRFHPGAERTLVSSAAGARWHRFVHMGFIG